jgi:phosphoribosylaminoimidazolecarboxamide formyltransferase/IMP cyclohydrolase
LHALGVTLVASGGTADAFAREGMPVERISGMTGFDDLLQGRVKTLHPAVYAGILARRGSDADDSDLAKVGVAPVDLVVVDLYPFTDANSEARRDHSPVELIDIGGVSLIRAAAKNFDRVSIVARAEQYEELAGLLDASAGVTTLDDRKRLAAEALRWTSFYDGCIASWLDDTHSPFHPIRTISLESGLELRYGENPHQQATFYTFGDQPKAGVAAAEVLGGKQLSFNNLLDLDIALRLPREFSQPAVAILKHTTPCGVGLGKSSAEAYSNALSTDPVSAFGGIAGFNSEVDEEAAQILRKGFMEVVAAPSYTPDALKELRKSKNLRIIQLSADLPAEGVDIRTVWGGLLVQQYDTGFPELAEMKVVTAKQPTESQLELLKFAWKAVRYVKSNAILLAGPGRTLGIGAGQMSRVDAARLAIWKAGESKLDLSGCVAGSDAFFPFRDGLDVLVDAGVSCIIQPGGSVRDEEVIAAANERGIAMIFTGRRHFRH